MNSRVLNRNDQIKRHDEGGELVEVIEVLEQAVNGADPGVVKLGQLILHLAVLQADKVTVLVLDQGAQLLKRDGAIVSPRLVGPSAPGNPDLQPGARVLCQECFPLVDPGRVHAQIRYPWK